jgi:tetratricopeptide (TPR) repeat protein
MTKLIKFQPKTPSKFGHKKVGSRKRLKLEEFGQLNLFDQNNSEAKVINFPLDMSPFEEALMLDENDPVRAREAYEKAINRKDHVADAYCNMGILESRENRTPQAFNCFTKALKHNPRHFEAHFNLANLYSDSGNLALARLHYEIAIEIKPRDPNPYYNLGLVLVLNKDFVNAIDSLEKYISLASEQNTQQAENLINNLRNSIPPIKTQ